MNDQRVAIGIFGFPALEWFDDKWNDILISIHRQPSELLGGLSFFLITLKNGGNL